MRRTTDFFRVREEARIKEFAAFRKSMLKALRTERGSRRNGSEANHIINLAIDVIEECSAIEEAWCIVIGAVSLVYASNDHRYPDMTQIEHFDLQANQGSRHLSRYSRAELMQSTTLRNPAQGTVALAIDEAREDFLKVALFVTRHQGFDGIKPFWMPALFKELGPVPGLATAEVQFLYDAFRAFVIKALQAEHDSSRDASEVNDLVISPAIDVLKQCATTEEIWCIVVGAVSLVYAGNDAKYDVTQFKCFDLQANQGSRHLSQYSLRELTRNTPWEKKGRLTIDEFRETFLKVALFVTQQKGFDGIKAFWMPDLFNLFTCLGAFSGLGAAEVQFLCGTLEDPAKDASADTGIERKGP